MQEWEYKWIQVEWVPTSKEKQKGATLVHGRWEGREEVEKAGQEGWELVSVQPFTSSYGGESWAGGPGASEVSSYMFFFKRPKQAKDGAVQPAARDLRAPQIQNGQALLPRDPLNQASADI